jgi:hypothetical protein
MCNDSQISNFCGVAIFKDFTGLLICNHTESLSSKNSWELLKMGCSRVTEPFGLHEIPNGAIDEVGLGKSLKI